VAQSALAEQAVVGAHSCVVGLQLLLPPQSVAAVQNFVHTL
jgi:hypothetical protein